MRSTAIVTDVHVMGKGELGEVKGGVKAGQYVSIVENKI